MVRDFTWSSPTSLRHAGTAWWGSEGARSWPSTHVREVGLRELSTVGLGLPGVVLGGGVAAGEDLIEAAERFRIECDVQSMNCCVELAQGA